MMIKKNLKENEVIHNLARHLVILAVNSNTFLLSIQMVSNKFAKANESLLESPRQK